MAAAQSLLDLEEDSTSAQLDSVAVSESQSGTIPSLIALAGPNASVVYERAVACLVFAIKNYPRESIEGDPGAKMSRDGQFARLFLDAAQTALSVAEEIQSRKEDGSTEDDDISRISPDLYQVQELYALLGDLDFVPADIRVQAIFGDARARLAIGATIAECLEDGGDTSETLRDNAIRVLKEGGLIYHLRILCNLT